MTEQEAKTFLTSLIETMNTQDNHATAAPYFYVIRKEKWRVAHEDYTSGETRQVWVDREDGEAQAFYSKEEYLEWFKEFYENDFKNEYELEINAENSFRKLEEFKQEQYFEEDNVFFTEQGYQDHLRINGHNIRNSHSYIKHAFRNKELENLFTAVGILIGKPWKKG